MNQAAGIRDGAPDDRRLFDLLAGFDSVVVAFSGGVDSAYLAWAVTQVLGPDRALCITADSPSYPDHHRQLALSVARGFATIVDGANADDRGDYRPGRQAAREFGVRSPLDEVNLTKADIRALSRRAGLPTWDEPASACLSSRIPYHSEVTGEKLRMIERAERVLRDFGFRVCRVRHHDDLARVEIGFDELPRALEPDLTARIVGAIQALGYRQVTIDPRGYRMGSLNEGVVLRPA